MLITLAAGVVAGVGVTIVHTLLQAWRGLMANDRRVPPCPRCAGDELSAHTMSSRCEQGKAN